MKKELKDKKLVISKTGKILKIQSKDVLLFNEIYDVVCFVPFESRSLDEVDNQLSCNKYELDGDGRIHLTLIFQNGINTVFDCTGGRLLYCDFLNSSFKKELIKFNKGLYDMEVMKLNIKNVDDSNTTIDQCDMVLRIYVGENDNSYIQKELEISDKQEFIRFKPGITYSYDLLTHLNSYQRLQLESELYDMRYPLCQDSCPV